MNELQKRDKVLEKLFKDSFKLLKNNEVHFIMEILDDQSYLISNGHWGFKIRPGLYPLANKAIWQFRLDAAVPSGSPVVNVYKPKGTKTVEFPNFGRDRLQEIFTSVANITTPITITYYLYHLLTEGSPYCRVIKGDSVVILVDEKFIPVLLSYDNKNYSLSGLSHRKPIIIRSTEDQEIVGLVMPFLLTDAIHQELNRLFYPSNTELEKPELEKPELEKEGR